MVNEPVKKKRGGKKPKPDPVHRNISSMIRMFAAPVLVEQRPEQFLESLDRIKVLSEVLAEVKVLVEQAAVEWIKHNGELSAGTKRFYVGVSKTTKCADPAGALEAVMDAAGGDFTRVVSALSSGAFKPGACRELLPPEVFERLFRTSEADELREGVAKQPKLQVVDTAFARRPVSPQPPSERASESC